LISIVSTDPSLALQNRRHNPSGRSVGAKPSTRAIRSPSRRPACQAGPPQITRRTPKRT